MESLAVLIGKRIRELRKERRLKQEEMESFGISYKYYQKIETGKVNVTLGSLEKIADALGVDPAELFVFQLDASKEVNELVASIREIISKNDRKTARKLNIFIKEILS